MSINVTYGAPHVSTVPRELQQPSGRQQGAAPDLARLAEEKAAQKAEQQQERDRARAQRMLDAKAERERQRNSPAGLAQAMIKDLNSIALKAGEKQAEAQNGVLHVPAPVCEDYKTRFSAHTKTVDDLRTRLNKVVAENETNEQTTTDLKKCLDQTNETLSQWARLKALYSKGKCASSNEYNQD